jgi:glucokinase
LNDGFAIGIDLGGTRIKAVAVEKEDIVLDQLYLPTNDNASGWKNSVAEVINLLLERFKKQNCVVGIAAPGLPNEDHSAIAYMPGRMQGLENFSWPGFLNQNTFVLNDAVAALVAEEAIGVAKNKKHAIMITLGTGVGGAIWANGKPYMGVFNKAGHIGHMVINDEGDRDITGMPGSLEECIGNCTIRKRSDGKFASTRDLLVAYRNGDDFAKRVWLNSVRQLAIGLASLSNILSPEIIILGGGITEAGSDLFDPLKEYMEKYEWRPGGSGVNIVKAALGDLAGAIGAAVFSIRNQVS